MKHQNNKCSPSPISLQRHVYNPMHENSDKQDFFNLESALKVTMYREATDPDPMEAPGINIVFQSPRKWLIQYTRYKKLRLK